MLKRLNFPTRLLLPALIAGAIIAVIDLFIEISMAALLFSGPLTEYISLGIGLLLFGGLVMNIVISLTSPTPGMITFPQESTAVILALIASSITVSVSDQEVQFATLVAVIILSTLLTGSAFLVIGRLKWSRLVRFVPYPVIGGFLAGTGLLILQGGFSVLTGLPLTLADLPALFQPDVIALWLPSLLFAVVLLVTSRRFDHPLLIPLLLLAAIVLFFVWYAIAGVSADEIVGRGLLLGSYTSDVAWRPYLLDALSEADWSVILDQALQIGAIVIVSVLAMLFNTSGIESTLKDDIDLDGEMGAAGFANLLAGLGGSPAGFQALSYTTLGRRMAPPTRLVGLAAAVCFGLFLIMGTTILAYFPVMVIGGVLIFLGLSFLADWLYDAWFILPRSDYALVLLILVVIGWFGFLEGVAAGIGIALLLFVYNYSRINIVKHTITGAAYHSSVDRPAPQREHLRQVGDQLLILQLQGYIFFGTAYQLLRVVRFRTAQDGSPPLRFLVLDFRLVNGLDASAASSFVRLYAHLEETGVRLVCSSVPPGVLAGLARAGFELEGTGGACFVPSLDDGVEYCENLLLEDAGLSAIEPEHRLEDQLERVLKTPSRVTVLFDYLVKLELAEGEHLVRQGEPAEDLYFVDAGMLAILLELDGDRSSRVGTIQPGTVVGEIGVYLGKPRTASVVAIQPSTVYRLSLSAFRCLETEHPEIAAALHQWIANILAERLSDNVSTLQALLA